ncbi:mast cell protease 1A [Octopus vulgaris]|uniref:Mast cell protease 1A n=1 Tax=Octopus vulgaris TaxID=6645 RepID=A0AA36BTJ4_OCTVU|nr:mast cell protease 1A [Octopus vulgaris]
MFLLLTTFSFALFACGVNDIAVITLKKAIKFSDCVKPIRLASSNEEFIGDCKAAGWGKTNGIQSSSSDKLLFVDIPLVDEETCNENGANVNEQHICAGEMKAMGKTTCQGDSGGPLACTSADDGETVLAAGTARRGGGVGNSIATAGYDEGTVVIVVVLVIGGRAAIAATGVISCGSAGVSAISSKESWVL